jgi:hypothetical protein
MLDVVTGYRNVRNRQREATLNEKLYVKCSHLMSLICNIQRETTINE